MSDDEKTAYIKENSCENIKEEVRKFVMEYMGTPPPVEGQKKSVDSPPFYLDPGAFEYNNQHTVNQSPDSLHRIQEDKGFGIQSLGLSNDSPRGLSTQKPSIKKEGSADIQGAINPHLTETHFATGHLNQDSTQHAKTNHDSSQ